MAGDCEDLEADLLGEDGPPPEPSEYEDDAPASADIATAPLGPDTATIELQNRALERQLIADQLYEAAQAGKHADVSELAAKLALLDESSPEEQARQVEVQLAEIGDLLTRRDVAAIHVASAPRTAARLELVTGAELFTALPPVAWLCEGLEMAPGAPSIWAGYGFSGKTYAAQALAISVASGRDAWGSFACRRGRVLHLDFEQGRTLTLKRYQKLARGLALTPDDIGDRLAVAPLPRLSLGDVTMERWLLQHTKDTALCIVDSFRAACPEVDENSSEARRPLDMLNRVSEATGCTFLVIHHSRKPKEGSTGGARMEMRGSGALYDAAASLFVFAGRKGEPTRLQHEKARISGKPREDLEVEIRDLVDDDGRFDGIEVVAQLHSTPTPAAREDRERDVRDQILAVLEVHSPKGLPTNAIRGLVKRNKSTVIEQLGVLEAQGQVESKRGSRGASTYRIVHADQGGSDG